MPEDYEPLIVESAQIAPGDIAEDELILSLPIVAMHALEDCPALQQTRPEQQELDEAEKPNPFSVLAQLQKEAKSKQEK